MELIHEIKIVFRLLNFSNFIIFSIKISAVNSASNLDSAESNYITCPISGSPKFILQTYLFSILCGRREFKINVIVYGQPKKTVELNAFTIYTTPPGI